MVYIFDTNTLSNIFKYYYTSSFLSFWERFNTLVEIREVLSVREVKNELDATKWSSDINDWLKGNRDIFEKPSEIELDFIRDIYFIRHFQNNIRRKSIYQGKPVADPFVISKARINGGTVVTEEEFKPNAAEIPNICAHFDVDCVNLEGFLTIQGWVF